MPDDTYWLGVAVDLATRCPPSDTAFSVGAVVVDATGAELGRGWSRAADPHDHAEEVALRAVTGDLTGATIYSSLEPCGRRASRPATCAQLIVASGLRRVVFALREPAVFVAATGADYLAEHAIVVVERPELADRVRAANAHLLG